MRNKHRVRYVWRFTALLCIGLMLQMAITGCQSSQTAPAATPGPEWQGVIPGVSTEADVVRILGQPATQRRHWKYVIYSYRSPVGGMSEPDEIAFQDGRVRVIRITTIENNLKLVLTRYGEPEKVTWPPVHGRGARLFIFANHGIAVVAENHVPPAESSILERWYFEPMSLEHFWETLAPAFTPMRPADPKDKEPEDYWVRE